MQKVSYGFKIATNEPYIDDLVTYLIKQMWVEFIQNYYFLPCILMW